MKYLSKYSFWIVLNTGSKTITRTTASFSTESIKYGKSRKTYLHRPIVQSIRHSGAEATMAPASNGAKVENLLFAGVIPAGDLVRDFSYHQRDTMKKADTKQMRIDFSLNVVVQNFWGPQWHIEKSNGLSIPGVPDWFDSKAAALAYASDNGIRIDDADRSLPGGHYDDRS